MGSVGIEMTPLPKPFPGSAVDFGVELSGIDVGNLTDDTFAIIRSALYQHNVVLIKNQHSLSSRVQCELTSRFDPDANVYSHGKSIDKRSVLHKDLTTIPSEPKVQVIGHGSVKSFEGLEDLKLTHPHHKNFHRHPIPAEDDLQYTHFYRWHIDSAMYDLDPPLVTSLFAASVPKGRRQICRYDDGSGEEMELPLGTTAFVSGYRMYDLLSEADKEFVRTSTIEYGAHPYIWMSRAKSRSNGLGLLSEGLELPDDELPAIEWSKIRRYPMVWKNPETGKLAMMVYPTPVRKIHLQDGTVMDELEQVRETIYRLQRPAISPQFVQTVDWQEGDLVLFNNHGLLHSITGAFAENEVRLFRQCNMAASRPPLGP
ncbi:alpha-ketoglutarate dependent xanthine dioxygenase [Grosmannia clavigera kw1407]|uniref:Alpha-ketoglutarate dependent xanthine dioxygenase n=1 Tax=Grosmannia clavigera (strain kw1407 / UAMH 11150) TaxID=655863 RepID=F0XSU9_GROCL|nr:alpha-ketoglutarate dependent xanthine dioxygenase [Grosmannia clavigera kw1407]EFW99197.1 alpha-ketoglutarate dependent xanthine dioxygenase [Grosmannia clavigera kw1407]